MRIIKQVDSGRGHALASHSCQLKRGITREKPKRQAVRSYRSPEASPAMISAFMRVFHHETRDLGNHGRWKHFRRPTFSFSNRSSCNWPRVCARQTGKMLAPTETIRLSHIVGQCPKNMELPESGIRIRYPSLYLGFESHVEVVVRSGPSSTLLL